MNKALLSLALFVALGGAVLAAPQVDDFEGGVNAGGWAFSSAPTDVHEVSGGNPGGWIHNPLVDTFAPVFRTHTTGGGFDGDFRALGVTGISVDAQTISTDFPVGGSFSLVLRDTHGTPSATDDDYAFYVGPVIPLPGAGWKSFYFSIPSASTVGTPPGWKGAWGGGCCTFRPGVDWNDVIQNVDRVEFWWLDPSFFAIYQQWGVGADNVHLHFDGSAVVRNGGGTNPVGFNALSVPRLGSAWQSSVDIATPGALASILVVSGNQTAGAILSGNIMGEVLVLPSFYLTDVSPTGTHSLPIPPSYSLSGQTVFAQAATFLPGNIVLNNGLDLTFGVQ